MKEILTAASFFLIILAILLIILAIYKTIKDEDGHTFFVLSSMSIILGCLLFLKTII